MYRRHPNEETSHYRPLCRGTDATRRARLLRLAADALAAAGRCAVDVLRRAAEARARRVTGEAARAGRIPNDAACHARVLRRAADVIDAALHGRPITARDVPRLLARLVDVHDAHAAAEAIRDLWAPGRVGRDAETGWLRSAAEFLLESGGQR
jgi:hypothetical protein